MIRSLILLAAVLAPAPLAFAQSFVNWETPHVHPLELAADGTRLLAVNTADNRLMVFDVVDPGVSLPVLAFEVPVGLDPVTVRLRTANEAWVVNHVSDSVSIVDLVTRSVKATLDTADEPCDVVFAGNPQRAFVSCSQANEVLVFDPANLAAAPVVIDIVGEEPRALAKSPDGSKVYAAIFESGNGTTILGGGLDPAAAGTLAFPPNVVNEGVGPYGGVNPPPNSGNAFVPAQNPGNPAPPPVGLIVRLDDQGQWLDDNGGDWTNLVSGPQAALSGRPVGWQLIDHDIAVIDANNLSVTYAERLMNLCMALAVNPNSGEISVVGTEATNEIRFEPNLKGKFTRVEIALVAAGGGATQGIVDLNGHLDYSTSVVPQASRDLSIGDPRGIVWSDDGTRAYVTGMGSNNVIVVDAAGQRAGLSPTMEVGEGPTGIALDDTAGRLYVLNKFEASVSTIDTSTEQEIARTPFFDPSPVAIKAGRKHLYDTHKNSGLGQAACGSCHIDSRMDRLAWDLGDPAGEMKSVNGQNLGAGVPGLNTGFEDWHPMKGPMTTQTLQDIIGKEPLHWRGDRDGIEEFNGAFLGLQGDDEDLTPAEMQEFEDFLATIHFPPNPFRNFDNSLPTNLPLDGHFTSGRFGPAGQPLPNGNALQGSARFRFPVTLDGILACSTCHTLPTGMGTGLRLVGGTFGPLPTGPNGEEHHALVSVDGSTQRSIKIPHLRNEYEKVGFETTQQTSLSGFGVLHDGSVDSLARFVSEPAFEVTSDQDVANIVAFMLALTGSDLPVGSPNSLLQPPGPESQDTHAGVGTQSTLVSIGSASIDQQILLASMVGLANTNEVGLVVKGKLDGQQRGWIFVGAGQFQSDRMGETIAFTFLENVAEPGAEQTWTIVPKGTEMRIGIDRDEDGFFDRDELDAASDPADPGDVPGALGTNYCVTAPNSAGPGALISGAGSTSVAANDVTLNAVYLPPGVLGIFYFGESQIQSPFGDGQRCVGGQTFRYPITQASSAGVLSYGPDLTLPTSAGNIVGGTSWNFQAWFRDPTGAGGNGFNLSNGFSIDFTP